MPIKISVTSTDPAALFAAADAALGDNSQGVFAAVETVWSSQVDRLNRGDVAPPLRPATIKRKAREGYPTMPLVRTGKMRDTIERRVDGDDGYVICTQFYGYVHQYGGANLPARRWMYIDPETEEKAWKGFQDDLLARPGLKEWAT